MLDFKQKIVIVKPSPFGGRVGWGIFENKKIKRRHCEACIAGCGNL